MALWSQIGILGHLAAPAIGGPVADAFGYGAVAIVAALTAMGVAVPASEPHRMPRSQCHLGPLDDLGGYLHRGVPGIRNHDALPRARLRRAVVRSVQRDTGVALQTRKIRPVGTPEGTRCRDRRTGLQLAAILQTQAERTIAVADFEHARPGADVGVQSVGVRSRCAITSSGCG